MKNTSNIVDINLMDCVKGTTTSDEGVALFKKMNAVLAKGNKIRLSLAKATPISSSFLNASFGEIYDKYGYQSIREHISLINYLPSQASQIKKYLEDVNKLAMA